ncbi:MAG: dienelactone hydrolase family protein [Verrucomicrobiota bacterium]
MKALTILLSLCAVTVAAHAQDWARAKLDQSPRHHEWVKIKQVTREVLAFLAFPEIKDKATAVIVIHENRGLTEWVRSVADQLAAEGYLAIAPDLLSGTAPNGGATSDYANQDAATKGIYALPPDQVTADLQAVTEYVTKLPAASGKAVVAGFCWGGSQTFRFATNNKEVRAAFVFYGTGPDDPAALARLTSPVFGFYGGNDARVNATIPKSTDQMRKAGKRYEPVSYGGAGHGFMRSGEEPNAGPENKQARSDAWNRWLELLKKI